MRRPRVRTRIRSPRDTAPPPGAPDFRALLDDVEGIVWEAEADTQRFTWVSRGAERLLGYPVEQWLADPIFLERILHPEDRTRILDASASSIVQVQDYRREYRVVAADGRIVWFADRVRVITDEVGRAVRLRGVMLDITERVRAEEKLHERNTRLRLLNAVTASMTLAADEETVLDVATSRLHEVFPFARVACSEVDPRGRLEVRRATEVRESPPGRDATVDLGVVPDLLRALRHGQAVAVEDFATDARVGALGAEIVARGVRAAIAVPAPAGDGNLVLVSLSSPEPRRWTEHEMATLAETADVLGAGLRERRDRRAKARAEERSRLLQSLTRDVAEADDVPRGLALVLRRLSEFEGWVLAQAWEPGEDGRLRRTAYHAAGPRTAPLVEASAAAALGDGECLPGRAWKEGRPQWAASASGVESCVRAAAATAAGVGAGLAVPVLAGARPVLVLEFFLAEERAEDPDRVELVNALGAQLGALVLRKRAEDARLHSEEEVRLIAENIRGLLWMSDPGKKEFSYIGPQYEEIWGRDRRDLLTDPLAWLSSVHPDDRERVRRAALEDQVLGRYDETYRILRPDGTTRWIHDRAFPVKDGSGRVNRIVGIAEDITERREGEGRLRLSEERFRVVSHATSDAVYDWDVPTGRVWWSAGHRELFGAPPGIADDSPRDWEERIHPGDRERVRAALAAEMEGRGSRWTAEYRYRRGDGSHADVNDRGWFLRDASGRVVRMIGAVVDVTRRKDLERELQQSQKMEAVGRLAGGVAHDFNNLLTAILGYAELLLARVPPGDAMARELSEIERAGQRAATLTRQLLAFSRRQVLQPRVLDLGGVAAGMEDMLRRLLGERVELVVVRDAAAGLVRVDRGQLEQVLLNLAVNARDAMPNGGIVTVTATAAPEGTTVPGAPPDAPPGAWSMLEVRDSGVGMDASVQARLFEPFFTTKGPGRGTGLGLSTVYGIVRQSGGFLKVESAPGRGAAFRVFLPRVEEPKAAAPGAGAGKGVQGAETILLVEDEEVVRSLVREVLRTRGYRVLEAAGGDEALQVSDAHDGPVHLLLTDVVMPRMNGRQLAERLRERRPGTRVLYVSGYTDDEVLRAGVTDLHSAFLNKPFTAEVVASKVREVLDRAAQGA